MQDVKAYPGLEQGWPFCKGEGLVCAYDKSLWPMLNPTGRCVREGSSSCQPPPALAAAYGAALIRLLVRGWVLCTCAGATNG